MSMVAFQMRLTVSHLIIKREKCNHAFQTFEDLRINMNVEGQKYLRSALGTDDYTDQLARSKVEMLCEQRINMAQYAESEPHAAYTQHLPLH